MDPIKNRQRAKDWYWANKARANRRSRANHIGMPTRLYEKYKTLRGVACETCGKEFTGPNTGKLGYRLDHDHATGQFRGWLCFECNIGLGMFRDNPAVLRRAAEYLERPRLEFQ